MDEFPAPACDGHVCMVSANGNHRSLVFACIGIPWVSARVQKAQGPRWRYIRADRGHAAEQVVSWFERIGLITRVKQGADGGTLIVEGPDNVAGWLLADPEGGSLRRMLAELQERAELVNTRFDLDQQTLSLLKSPIRRRVSLQYAWILHNMLNRRRRNRKPVGRQLIVEAPARTGQNESGPMRNQVCPGWRSITVSRSCGAGLPIRWRFPTGRALLARLGLASPGRCGPRRKDRRWSNRLASHAGSAIGSPPTQPAPLPTSTESPRAAPDPCPRTA